MRQYSEKLGYLIENKCLRGFPENWKTGFTNIIRCFRYGPDKKGIETGQHGRPGSFGQCFRYGPDKKGIETSIVFSAIKYQIVLGTAPTRRGLKHIVKGIASDILRFRYGPDKKGIETCFFSARYIPGCRFRYGPDKKGIETS